MCYYSLISFIEMYNLKIKGYFTLFSVNIFTFLHFSKLDSKYTQTKYIYTFLKNHRDLSNMFLKCHQLQCQERSDTWGSTNLCQKI